jgi:hypothetical protein
MGPYTLDPGLKSPVLFAHETTFSTSKSNTERWVMEFWDQV